MIKNFAKKFTSIRNIYERALTFKRDIGVAFENRIYNHTTFASSGEDLIIGAILEDLIKRKFVTSDFTYFDFGANAPFDKSNSAFFYSKGHRGVLIEANPYLCKALKAERKGDIVLSCAVVPNGETNLLENIELTIFEHGAIGSIVKSHNDNFAAIGHKIIEKIKVPAKTVTSIISGHSSIFEKVGFVSIDIEGLDEALIYSWDFQVHRPPIFVVETVDFDHDGNFIKNPKVINYLIDNGYILLADTLFNSIFAEKKFYPKCVSLEIKNIL